jgi:diadenosine tetraphosphate (Ap4A) HIT family hydrolase
MKRDCVFCKIGRGEIPSYRVHEDALTLAFMDAIARHRGR